MSDHTLEADAKAGTEAGETAVTEAGRAEAADAVDRQAEILRALGQAAGKEYGSIEEATRHIEGLKKLVGDNVVASQRKKAELAESLIRGVAEENGWDRQKAEEYLLNLSTKKHAMDTEAKAAPVTAPDIEERLRRGERAEFLLEVPEAKPYLQKIDEYAKATGKSYKDAYDTLYADVVKSEKSRREAEEAEKAKRDAVVSASHDTSPPPLPDAYKESMDAYRKTGKSEHLQKAIKIRNERSLGIK